MRIALAGLAHETNTFAHGLTTLADFQRSGGFPGLLLGAEVPAALQAAGVATSGFLAAAQDLGLEVEPLLWTFAQPSGLVEQAAYETLKAMLLQRLQAALPVDAVYLDLHGAMVTEGLPDAEGDLLAAVREVVGRETPVVATLDLHANLTAQMAAHADALIGYDTYPHVDAAERGAEAAWLLADTLAGRCRPVLALRQAPMLIGPPRQCTLMAPMADLIAQAHEIERRPGILCVTVAGGFPFADIPDAGAAIAVTADGDRELAQAAATELATEMWRRREQFRLHLTPVREAIAETLASGQGPVILADGSDNPGGGAPCDGTFMLQALIEANAPRSVVCLIADPQAVAEAIAAGVGSEVTLTVGGKTDDQHGPPLTLTGQVRLISDGLYRNRGPMFQGLPVSMGRTVVFVVGEVEVVLTERRVQPYDCQALRCLGLEPAEKLLIGLKSAVHFRADYGPLAHRIYDLDTPGVHNPDVTRYPFQRLRRPIWPLEEADITFDQAT